MNKPIELYHFTCSHGHEMICRSGRRIIPQVSNPYVGAALSWFTTESTPARCSVGLTLTMLQCDRMAHRYIITDLHGVTPWLTSIWRMATLPHNRDVLELHASPGTWWVSDRPIVAEYDPEWHTARQAVRNPHD